jgi:class 3 adenylate cyclase
MGGARRADGTYRYRWTWTLRASPDQLWPLVADTDRFDRDAGLPPLQRSDDDGELTNARSIVRLRQFGVPLEYTQEPFEWSRPHGFSVTRSFSKGPLARLRIEAALAERDDGGTDLEYTVEARPRSAVTAPAIPIQVGWILARRFDRLFRRYDEAASSGSASTRTGGRIELVPGARQRAEVVADRLRADAVPDPVVDRLVDTVLTADDVAAGRLRPYALADEWRFERPLVLDAMLRATRHGLLAFRWDVLCPRCGVAKSSTGALADMPSSVHCATCNIDYEANLSGSVELTFRPVRSVRHVDHAEYCIGSPMATPHVVEQRLVGMGQVGTVGPLPETGRYRVRAFERPGSQTVEVVDGGPDEVTVRCPRGAWSDEVPNLDASGRLTLGNDTGEEQLFLVERTRWNDDAVTGAEVIARQEFRDLFADEALRAGEQIDVGTITVAFTDLRGSTRFYREVGDAVAFGRVLDHFDVLGRAINREGGAVVKTIGDAVMAVFPSPVRAVRALLDAQAAVRARSAGELELKAGIHAGPCIAVTLNGQLDYFGTTVNLASRLEALSGAEDIVVSESVVEDPEVQDLLSESSGPAIAARPLEVALKGFEVEAQVWQVRTASSPP